MQPLIKQEKSCPYRTYVLVDGDISKWVRKFMEKRTIKNKINKINAYFEKFGNSILNYICIKPYRHKSWNNKLTISLIVYVYDKSWASLVVQNLKNLSARQNMWVWSLDWENLLEKGMAAYSSILAWRIPWTEEPGGLQSMGSQRVRHDWVTLSLSW